MRRSRGAVGSWTPLLVDDVVGAAAYYRDVLGCQQLAMLGGTPPRLAILSGFGTTLLLQERPTTDHEQEGLGGPPWDAVVAVPDVGAAHADLAKRGVLGLSDVSEAFLWEFFEFQDSSGNLICIGESLAPSKSWRPPGGSLLTRVRGQRQTARTDREEREHLRAFQAFYENLEDKKDVFYMFFTSGLLHWVTRSESFVPADVNLVLIGSALTDDEQRWVTEHLDRPFHHVDLAVDDITVWDFLFATCEENFGWLDIDCFVLNSQLFTEMADVAPDRSLNCIWAAETGYGFTTAATHFLFMNVDAIKAVAARGVRPSACTYDWTASQRLFPQRECYTRVPTRTERKLLLQELPADEKGRPHFLNGSTF